MRQILRWIALGLCAASIVAQAPVLDTYDVAMVVPYAARSEEPDAWTSYPLRDDADVPVDLPFPFTYWGNTYNSLRISSNGYVQFGWSSSVAILTSPLPTHNPARGNYICAWCADLDPRTTPQGVQAQMVGSGGDRRFVVRWHRVPYFGSPNLVSASIALYERDNSIKITLDDIHSAPSSGVVVGINNLEGSDAVVYRFNSVVRDLPQSITATAVLFRPTDAQHRHRTAGDPAAAAYEDMTDPVWIPESPCAASPCAHGGLCIPTSAAASNDGNSADLGGFVCVCAIDYHGDDCSTPAVSSPMPVHPTPAPGPIPGPTPPPNPAPTPIHPMPPGPQGPMSSYAFPTEIPYAFPPEPSNTLALTDDSISAPIQLPFTFSFFGYDYDHVVIGSNGFISFSDDPSRWPFSARIPSSSTPNNFVCGLCTDLNPSASGNIYYGVSGTAPNRQFTVSFMRVPYFASAATVSFAIVLEEQFSNIKLHYQSCDPTTRLITIGVENHVGTDGVSFRYNNQRLDTTLGPVSAIFRPMPMNPSVRPLGCSSPDCPRKHSLSGGAVAGIVLGSVGIILLALLVVYRIRKCRAARAARLHGMQQAPGGPVVPISVLPPPAYTPRPRSAMAMAAMPAAPFTVAPQGTFDPTAVLAPAVNWRAHGYASYAMLPYTPSQGPRAQVAVAAQPPAVSLSVAPVLAGYTPINAQQI